MTCGEFATFMGDFIAGELPEPALRAFHEHLDVCDNCRRYLTSYRESVTLGRRVFEDERAPVPADIPAELVRAILSARRSPAS